MEKIPESSLAIKQAIFDKRNFSVVAGAGAGKTGALVQALLDARSIYGKDFRQNGQKIACITYTNVAVDVIKSRTQTDDLFLVSTLHAFLWSLIGQFDDDLRLVLKEEIIPARIEKKRKDEIGESKKAQAARAQILRLKDGLAKIETVDEVKYDVSGRRNYAKGKIDHDDVIDMAALLLSRSSVLQAIVSQRFPIILIDEAQDTFGSIMTAFNVIAASNGFPIVGYFGDPMQQIYENRAGNFEGPSGTEVIKIKENHRCSKEVIKLLNKIRTDIQQVPGGDNVEGSVNITLIETEEGRGYRKAYDSQQLEDVQLKFDNAVQKLGWTNVVGVKSLFLTRQMIAQRLGFAELNRLFTGEFSSKASEDEFKDGTHFLIENFVDILVPVIEAKRFNNGDAIAEILLKVSPIVRPNGKNKHTEFNVVVEQVLKALQDIDEVWDTGTVKDILIAAIENEILEPSNRLLAHLKRSSRSEIYDEVLFGAEREEWLVDSFFKFKIEEVVNFRNFVLKQTPFSTQHGVKGDQFEKVLVVFDDTEANWSHYSFSKLFTPKTVGALPTEGQAKKSRNLAYVCFSRAKCDLRIILFTKDVIRAKEELKNLFNPEQIDIFKHEGGVSSAIQTRSLP